MRNSIREAENLLNQHSSHSLIGLRLHCTSLQDNGTKESTRVTEQNNVGPWETSYKSPAPLCLVQLHLATDFCLDCAQ